MFKSQKTLFSGLPLLVFFTYDCLLWVFPFHFFFTLHRTLKCVGCLLYSWDTVNPYSIVKLSLIFPIVLMRRLNLRKDIIILLTTRTNIIANIYWVFVMCQTLSYAFYINCVIYYLSLWDSYYLLNQCFRWEYWLTKR